MALPMLFGQPRQEELLANLLERNMDDREIREMTKGLVINLAPLVHQQVEEKKYNESNKYYAKN